MSIAILSLSKPWKLLLCTNLRQTPPSRSDEQNRLWCQVISKKLFIQARETYSSDTTSLMHQNCSWSQTVWISALTQYVYFRHTEKVRLFFFFNSSAHTCQKPHLRLGHLHGLSDQFVPLRRAGGSILPLGTRPVNAGFPARPGRRRSSGTLDLKTQRCMIKQREK